MRALLVLLSLAVLVVAALIYIDFIRLPVERAGSISIQTPKIGLETGRVSVGSEQRTVTTPTLNVERPGGNTQAPR